MVATPTCQHRLLHVQGPTGTLARRNNLSEASNPLLTHAAKATIPCLTPAQKTNLAELLMRRSDVVAVRSKHYGGYPNV